MDGTAASSGGLRVGKLLPKGLSAKRRRRKDKNGRDSEASGADDDTRSTSAHSSQRRFKRELTLESDDANSTNIADDDDEMDDRSFGSFESGADPETADRGRPASSSAPARPATISAHPSLIGYLTTSSPVVQTQHLDSRSHFLSSSQARGYSSGSSDKSLSPEKPSKAKGVPGFQNSIPEPPAPAKIASADRKGRASTPKIETNPPRTPPQDDKPAPVIVNTPPTPTDRADHPQFATSPDGRSSTNGAGPKLRADGSAAASNMNIHRRSKSGSAAIGPSKLSHITAAPLTPTDETGGETTQSATGFFSSMISAAQNAATSISNTIPSTGLGIGSNKNRTGTPKSLNSPAASQTTLNSQPAPEPEPRIEDTMDRKESAVRTLGSGDLSLSQLGLPESSITSPAGARFADVADTRTRSESAPTEPQTSATDVLPAESSSRPRSLAEPASGDQTPPQTDISDLKGPVQRSSSLRSAMKPHRKRGSSATTGGTIAAAITSATNAALPTSGGVGAPKLTGFAIASKKRNRDFHNLFKSVPDDDYLIEDYSCALQREILAHGRLYVSEGHLCFSSNILGWTTTLVMSFDEIVSVEKRSTALVFKNGLMISTLHAKHIFASFTSRDATYDLIVNIWKLGHPTLRSTLNGVQLEGTGGDKTEKVEDQQGVVEEEPQEASGSEEDTDDDEGDDEEFYDEEEHDEVLETQSTDMTAVEPDPERPATRKVSGMTAVNGVASEPSKDASPPPGGAPDFPGPSAHAPTDCGDSTAHYEKVLGDEIIPAPLGKVYNLVFGPGSVTWMNKWLSTEQKCTDIQMEDKKGLTADNKSRTFTYIKPLNGSIGPKQTKCVVTETIDQMDLEKAVNLSVSTQNPDVPYGNLFTVKTKYCLSWAENNATRIQINCTVDWSGKCWLKGTIEKNVNDGQGQYCKELFASLRSAVSSRARSGTATNGIVKGKKKLKRSKALQAVVDLEASKGGKSDGGKQNWGPLEPVRSILEPCVDVLQPILTGNVMYGLLVGLLVAMWFGFGSPPKNNAPFGPDVGFYSHNRQAAYEEMWRRQDSELWEWLEERVGMERLSSDQPSARKRGMEHRTVEDKLREERMDEREIQEAIRVTEEKLRVLREVIGKGRPN
ncbi:GRAM domain protein [Metarhizium robertsii]|uniref:GRAM domain-containing protein n=2 Tax=Metarhizium robertsii TaxID=568076 RepID=E9F6P8_METRA|nr:GRAM domain-containing protein [Metarhizium robertsii ARSEF 23]EFY96664.2 GRAM domain-containing protein [Metarhizium robertsii ARSEF 23]EXU98988.1 GRAM domain protein [Metarhizium robertsii]